MVYNNRNNGQQANVVLDEDALAHKNGPETNNGVILTTANGLGTGAHIGVYVVGDDSTNPYADHGQSTQPFGTVQGSDTSKQNLGDDIVPGSRDGVVMSIGYGDRAAAEAAYNFYKAGTGTASP